jgi:hypothetical protein
VQGNQGNAGTNGTNGAQGNQGNAGTNGTNGAQGNQGNAGTNGTNGAQGNQGNQGNQGGGGSGPQGNQGVSGAGGGGITTYYEDSGAAITPSLNTSIRVIAGPYWSNYPSNNLALTMPTATASNDYLNVEYIGSYEAVSNGGFYGKLQVTFPSSNQYDQSLGNYVTYVWESNVTSSFWTITTYYGNTVYSN